MSTKTELNNAIAENAQALRALGNAISRLERQLREEKERAEIIEACRGALAALESPEAQKVLVWTDQREALRNVLAKLSK